MRHRRAATVVCQPWYSRTPDVPFGVIQSESGWRRRQGAIRYPALRAETIREKRDEPFPWWRLLVAALFVLPAVADVVHYGQPPIRRIYQWLKLP